MTTQEILQATCNSWDTSSSAQTIQYASNCTTGSLLSAFISFRGSGTPTVTVSDSTNGSWSQAGSYVQNGTTWVAWFYFINNASTGKPTVTVTPSANVFLAVGLHEHSVLSSTGISVDATHSNTGSSSSAPSTGTCTVNAGDLVLAGFGVGDNIMGTVTNTASGFTLENSQTSGSGMSGNFQSVVTSDDINGYTNVAATWSTGISSVTYAALAVSFSNPSTVTHQYLTHGSYSLTLPSNVVAVIASAFGAGGSGGGGNGASGGNGGGGGGFGQGTYACSGGDVLSITVGAGSTGGTFNSMTGNNGTSGGTSSVTHSATTICSGNGGDGGNGANNTGATGNGGTATGNISTSTGTNGQLNSAMTGGQGGAWGGGNGGNSTTNGQDSADGYVYITVHTGGPLTDSMAINGAGSISMTPTVIKSTSASISGHGSFSCSGTVAHVGICHINGAGNFSCTSKAAYVATLAINGAGLFTFHSPVAHTDSMAINGVGSFSCTGKVIRNGACHINGVGNLTMTAGVANGADSLRFWFTGATSYNGTQSSQSSSLGHYKSSTEAQRIGILQASAVNGCNVLIASGHNQPGTGTILTADTSSLAYTAPGSSTGGMQTVDSGATGTLFDGQDSSSWVRVGHVADEDFRALASLEFVQQFNNLFGMSNAANAESTGGGNRYRAFMMTNDFDLPITNIEFWLNGGPSTAITAGLGASGSGTITGAAEAFCSFLPQGWIQIQSSGGSLKEIVYYSSRTDSVLTVPSLGRARLGTTATAGSSTDLIFQVPPIRIAYEQPSPKIGGPIQTIANESTAPTSVTWNTGISNTTGVSVGTLNTGEQAGIWIHRELPAGVDACARVLNSIKCSFQILGTTYYETLEGLFRIAIDALQRYELYVGDGVAPNLAGSPTATGTTYPLTFTPTAGHTYQVQLVARNCFNLASPSPISTLTFSGGGSLLNNPPSAPTVVSFAPGLSGVFNLLGVYMFNSDPPALQADKFHIYIRYDGTNPNPSIDTPVTVSAVKNTGVAPLRFTSPTETIPTTAKVILRTYRSSDGVESTNSDVHTATSGTTPFVNPALEVFWRKVAQQT